MGPHFDNKNQIHFGNAEYQDRIKAMWERGHTRGAIRGWSSFQTLRRCLKEATWIDRSWGKRMAQERQFYLEMCQARLG